MGPVYQQCGLNDQSNGPNGQPDDQNDQSHGQNGQPDDQTLNPMSQTAKPMAKTANPMAKTVNPMTKTVTHSSFYIFYMIIPRLLDIIYSHIKDMYSAPANLITILYPISIRYKWVSSRSSPVQSIHL